MKLRSRSFARLACVVTLPGMLCAPHSALADDFKLKDGSKISGSIVGYDDNSFRVKTSYGYALVQKDQVVSITITPPPKIDDSGKKPDANLDKPAIASKPAPPEPAKHIDVMPTAPKIASLPSAPPALVAATQPPPPPAPPNPPEPIRENVNGNTYTNETFGFQMYKPPAWQVIAGAQTLMPGAIAAMGTADQTTYLLIGQGAPSKSPNTDADTAQKRLSGIMENFRPVDEKNITVAGSAAIERHFRGSVDMKDWSGVVVLVPHGTQLFTIFGMTLADTDLVQIQENVIARAIASLHFTTP